jgi:hypothetical protein
VNGVLDKLKSWFRTAEREREGETPVATPPGGPERETSTNAQVEGAAGEPWPGND